MKLKREDFPASLPAETVDRIIAFQATSNRGLLWSRLILFSTAALGLGVFFAALRFDWPLWTHALGLVVFTGGAKVAQILMARRSHAVLVKFGATCPKCGQQLHTGGVSAAEAQEQWKTVLSGHCPRCLERISPDILGTTSVSSA